MTTSENQSLAITPGPQCASRNVRRRVLASLRRVVRDETILGRQQRETINAPTFESNLASLRYPMIFLMDSTEPFLDPTGYQHFFQTPFNELTPPRAPKALTS
jgi:hypothetical protein